MVYRTGKVGVLLIAGILMTLLGIAACAPQAPVPTATKAAAPPATNTAQATAAPTSPAAPTQAAATPKPTAPPAALQVVKVADLGAMGETPFYIALEKGYFKEQGIDAKFERFSTGGDEVPPLATGELHVGGGTAGAGLFNSLARGLAIKAVAMKSRPEIPNDTNWWMVRSDLKDQIKTFADFKGRTVNMVSPASIVYYGLALSLAKQGLSLKDIKTVDLGGPETAGAFQKKDIDISLVFEPNATLFQDQGLAVKWGQLTVDSGPLDISPVLYSEKWAKENPELAKKFMVAYLKGHREYYTAVRKGPNRKEVIDIVINHTALKDAAMYEKMTWTSAPKEGAVDKESLRKLQDWLVQNGYQQNKVDIDSLVDNSYVLNANQVLGEFKP